MIVVGAGIIGLSCAWRLAQRGLKVSVFDAREAGREASWAGAGMLSPDGEFKSDPEMARMARRSLEAYPEFVGELADESGYAIDFRICGAVEESRLYPEEALVDPRDVTRALIAACRKRGVQIFEHHPVARVADTPDGALIAAGAWSGGMYPGLPRTMPVRGHLVAWRKKPGLLGPIRREGHTYLMQRSSGLLIAGSTTENAGFNRGIDDHAVTDIQARAATLMPELTGIPPDEVWNGFRPGIEAGRPMIGRIPGTRVWTAFGHYRNGILLAPETARLIVETI